MDLLEGITGFEDSVRKFICHVVGITYQHIDRWLLAEMLGDLSDSQLKVWMSKYGCSQEESIKPKNIMEKIDFDSVSSIMASSHEARQVAVLPTPTLCPITNTSACRHGRASSHYSV
ncbi:Eukaryotic translation initiation factor 3 subunit K [Saguinus oedipus]|uniref:Eukaryotic translation initiation factor 3 subunit K n=1 Tax=Saguinus oedipus TaxID=9490 RepID=A0ABQ9W061_SAGOE|nr:Eukaryotic translation initiation factor 3 subunit K [Saguinus oedipus]